MFLRLVLESLKTKLAESNAGAPAEDLLHRGKGVNKSGGTRAASGRIDGTRERRFDTSGEQQWLVYAVPKQEFSCRVQCEAYKSYGWVIRDKIGHRITR